MYAHQVLCLVRCTTVATALLQLVAANSWCKATDSIEFFSLKGDRLPSEVQPIESVLRVISGNEEQQDGQVLEVEFAEEVSASGVEFVAEEFWDCSKLGNFRFSFDATNSGNESVHIYCIVRSPAGGNQRRSVCVPAQSSGTYYFELKGDGLGEDRGLRDDPASLEGVGTKMVIQGAKYEVNFDKVKSVRLFVVDLLEKKVLQIGNVRFVSNPPIQPGYLAGLLDRFGQRSTVDYEIKVHSKEQLKQLADEELAQLRISSPLADRSKYGGWKDGPQLDGTGYFRTEKVGSKWALVDPEGYLYFATGIDNTRMANTSTFTGVDFEDPSIREIDPEDVTPEDSQLRLGTSDAVRKSRFVSSELRHKMFNWLPDYSDPLAKYYGYRRSSHRGPMQHGEVFSFYMANLERRYGNPSPGYALRKWEEVTVDRMLDWGFTSMGNWTDPAFYHNNRIPYFANGWVIGDFKTVSSGNDYWRPLPDPFDPEFARRAKVTTQTIAEEVKGSPWCVGVFIDNEKSWGSPGSVKKQYGIVLHSLARNAEDCPTKAVFMAILESKYDSIDALNEAWKTEIESWEALAKGVDQWEFNHGEQLVADYSVLLEAYATKYFQVVHDALQEAMPNHLYLGVRFTAWGMSPETRKAARKYCDVVSFNYYREGLGDQFWSFLEEYDMPCIIGEFHMGSTDTGCFHPGLIAAANQKDRARMWRVYMDSLVSNPYFVGGHWFQYIDSPLTGRALDGENYNVGYVTVTDVPYPHMVQAAKEFHESFYQRRYGDVQSR